MRKTNTVCAKNENLRAKSRIRKKISEVSPTIRCPIPKTAFWLDFLIAISPKLKKDFKTKGNASD